MQALQDVPVVTELLEGAGVWRRIQGTRVFVAFEGNDTLLLDHGLTFIRLEGITQTQLQEMTLLELSQAAKDKKRHCLSELSVELKSHLMKVLIPEKGGHL